MTDTKKDQQCKAIHFLSYFLSHHVAVLCDMDRMMHDPICYYFSAFKGDSRHNVTKMGEKQSDFVLFKNSFLGMLISFLIPPPMRINWGCFVAVVVLFLPKDGRKLQNGGRILCPSM